jgi:hypothetical protein
MTLVARSEAVRDQVVAESRLPCPCPQPCCQPRQPTTRNRGSGFWHMGMRCVIGWFLCKPAGAHGPASHPSYPIARMPITPCCMLPLSTSYGWAGLGSSFLLLCCLSAHATVNPGHSPSEEDMRIYITAGLIPVYQPAVIPAA